MQPAIQGGKKTPVYANHSPGDNQKASVQCITLKVSKMHTGEHPRHISFFQKFDHKDRKFNCSVFFVRVRINIFRALFIIRACMKFKICQILTILTCSVFFERIFKLFFRKFYYFSSLIFCNFLKEKNNTQIGIKVGICY